MRMREVGATSTEFAKKQVRLTNGAQETLVQLLFCAPIGQPKISKY